MKSGLGVLDRTMRLLPHWQLMNDPTGFPAPVRRSLPHWQLMKHEAAMLAIDNCSLPHWQLMKLGY